MIRPIKARFVSNRPACGRNSGAEAVSCQEVMMWRGLTCLLGILIICASNATAADDVLVPILDDVSLYWDEEKPDPATASEDGGAWRFLTQFADATVDLPEAPRALADMRSITAVIEVTPQYTTENGFKRPNDPWTRLGMLSVLMDDGAGGQVERELVRFVTPYGGPAVFEQDVTALGPLLHGQRTLRAYISTFSEEPGWTINVSLRYSADTIGARRPHYARLLFADSHVTSASNTLRKTLTIPDGLDMPRLRVLTSGHATDGTAENEFVSCTHVLRIDGRIIARWRPWSERGGELRELNPTAGRWKVDGREIRSSDLDRSGWHPGLAVEPMIIPMPELTPGRHRIELTVLGIRPKEPPDPETGAEPHGYWVISAFVVADSRWPENIAGGNEP